MRGDILFYQAGRSLSDRLIQWATHGPYVHCEVDLGDGTAIGSHWDKGVNRHPLTPTPYTYTLQTPPQRLDAGLAWLTSHLGDSYGVADIMSQVLSLLWPHRPVVLGQPHGFDCSDLVARYVDQAGGLELGNLLDCPELISPNDLARCCGLLKG